MSLPARDLLLDIEPGDRLLRQREAAELIGVSVSYLRASSCPKRLLPSAGRGRKPLVRYVRAEVLAWVAANSRRE